MAEFKPITLNTQEEYDALVNPLLQAEREKFKDYDALKQQNTDLNGQVERYQATALREQVARKTGLPYELAARLNGKDEKELTADAQNLLELTKHKNPPSPQGATEPAGDNKNAAKNSKLKEQLRAMRGEV